jgi:hypothetical protein
MHRLFTALIAVALVATVHTRALAQRDSTPLARADRDSTIQQLIHMRDGSLLLGRIVAEDSTTIRLETAGGTLTLARTSVLDIKTIRSSDLRDGEYWFRDPNRTRLFFAPTGRMLDQGEGYYMNTYLLLQNFVTAPTSNVTVGGGFTLIPGVAPDKWAYYVTPKVGLHQSEDFNVAAGAFIGFDPEGSGHGFGLLYTVGTWGGADGSVTGGLGLGYAGTSFASRPALMLGGEHRVSRRVALVTENYAFVVKNSSTSCGSSGCETTSRNETLTIASYGLRFLGEKMSVDLAFWNAAGGGVGASWVFPGIPYVSFGVKF